MSLPSGVSPWNSIFGPGRRSKYNITNNSIKHQSFVYIELNDQTILFQTIQFGIRHLFALSLNVKQFYLTFRLDPFRCYHSDPEWTWERWQCRGILHYPKQQQCWSLTIRLFRIISRTLSGESLTPLLRSSRCILQPQPTGLMFHNDTIPVYLVYKENFSLHFLEVYLL